MQEHYGRLGRCQLRGGVRLDGSWARPHCSGERVARSGVVRELGVMASMPGVEASSGVRLGLLVARSSLQLGVRFI